MDPTLVSILKIQMKIIIMKTMRTAKSKSYRSTATATIICTLTIRIIQMQYRQVLITQSHPPPQTMKTVSLLFFSYYFLFKFMVTERNYFGWGIWFDRFGLDLHISFYFWLSKFLHATHKRNENKTERGKLFLITRRKENFPRNPLIFALFSLLGFFH